uniref:Beta-lactamase-related domain-containing protein n=1 Tax=Panagrolaimus sp. ES5 TaxID=591445 RepID=A0AC34FD90_9BILA
MSEKVSASNSLQFVIQTFLKWFKAIATVISLWIIEFFQRKPKIIHVQGFVEPGFEAVKNAFIQNLESNWEHEGASLTVYHKNKLVVDLWGGYADKECRRLWQKDTISVAFSSTKAIASLCIALLVDKGLISYDDKITKFWPEFSKHGKGSITIQWVLSHLSGLAYFDTPIMEADARDWKRMAKIIENEKPKWKPGTAVGYHAITFGWICDQIIRRIDPQQRSLTQFFNDEIRGNSDFHIGLNPSEAYRVARIKLPSIFQRLSEYWTNPHAVDYPRFLYDFVTDGILSKVEKNPNWLRFVKEMSLNNPDFYTLEQSALMGIGNARSLAEIFNRAIFEKQIFKDSETLKKLATPFIKKEDIVTGALVARGQGLMFSPFIHSSTGKLCQMIGHAGYGGQNIKFDLENELCFGYVSNGLKSGFGDSARTFVRLRDSIYSCILSSNN